MALPPENIAISVRRVQYVSQIKYNTPLMSSS